MRYFVVLLAVLAVLVGASSAYAQDEYDCEDFSTQQEAQATFSQDTSDPYGLDEDPGADDGKACEELASDPNASQGSSAPTQSSSASEGAATSQYQYNSADQYSGSAGQSLTVLPDTGGMSLWLALGVVLLLIGAGLWVFANLFRERR
jgi:hypothetical protein